MKILSAAILFLLTLNAVAQKKSVYDITLQKADNSGISLSAFQGKKILFVTCSASGKDVPQLRKLDSMFSARQDIIMIALPLSDYASDQIAVNRFFSDSIQLQFSISKMITGSRQHASQHALMRWLTNKEENIHFDDDISGPGEIFLVNEQGRLYARLAKGTILGGIFFSRLVGGK